MIHYGLRVINLHSKFSPHRALIIELVLGRPPLLQHVVVLRGYRSAQEMPALFPYRVICVRGTVEGMSQAEAAISAKLAECMEHEMQQASMVSTWERSHKPFLYIS